MEENKAQMKTKHVIVPFDVKSLEDDEGIFTGYGSVFGNRDAYGDIVTRGAFAQTLQNKDPKSIKLLWQHNADEPIGVYLDMHEDDTGLFVRGQLLINDIVKAKEAYALLKAGAINGLSIGYTYNDSDYTIGQDGNRYLNNINLWEVSVVTFPANQLAQVEGVKQSPTITNIREFESFLRDSGFSNSAAVNIASHGYVKGLQRDADSHKDEELVKNIREILTALKEGAKQYER